MKHLGDITKSNGTKLNRWIASPAAAHARIYPLPGSGPGLPVSGAACTWSKYDA